MKRSVLKILFLNLLFATYLIAAAQVSPSNPDLVPFRKGIKWGYSNSNKKIIVPCKYDSVAEHFYQNRAFVMLDGKFGYVDSSGKLVIPIKFSSVSNFNNTEQPIAAVTKQGENMWIDLTGKKFEGQITSAGAYLGIESDELDGRIIKNADKYGFAVRYYRIDSTLRKGKRGLDTVVMPIYENLLDSKIGLLIAELDSKWGVVNIKNEIIVPFVWDSLSSGYHDGGISDFKGFKAEKEGLYGLLDINGNILVPVKYKKIILPESVSFSVHPNDKISPIKVQTTDGNWGYVSEYGIEYFAN